MKSINNLNTLKALIRDEEMAMKEYFNLANGEGVPPAMKNTLLSMSSDEARHALNLKRYMKMRK